MMSDQEFQQIADKLSELGVPFVFSAHGICLLLRASNHEYSDTLQWLEISKEPCGEVRFYGYSLAANSQMSWSITVDDCGDTLAPLVCVPAVMDALQAMKCPLEEKDLRSLSTLFRERALLQVSGVSLMALLSDLSSDGVFLLLSFPLLKDEQGKQVALHFVFAQKRLEYVLTLSREAAEVLAFIVQHLQAQSSKQQ